MKKTSFLFIAVLLLTWTGLAYTPNPDGRISGNGYIAGNTISMQNGSFVSRGFPYQGYNHIEVRGDFEDLQLKLQVSTDGFETIKEERTFQISSGEQGLWMKAFEGMQGKQARYVLESDTSYRIDSITLEKSRNLSGLIIASVIILIIVGFGLFIKWQL